jgi:hypothetical protein
MTDTIQPTATIPDRDDWQKQTRDRDRLAGEVLDENKTALFGALSQTAIATVIVHFDGYGDSGQIEAIEAQAAGAAVPLPEGTIGIASPFPDGSGVQRISLPVREAIEQLAYDLLGQTYCGWQDNDGAYGDFTFDVADRTITLDYHQRFTDSELFEHSW